MSLYPPCFSAAQAMVLSSHFPLCVMMGVVTGCSQSDLWGQEVLFSEMAERLHQGVLLSWWNRSAGGLTSSQVLQLELRKPAGLQGEARLQQNTTQTRK